MDSGHRRQEARRSPPRFRPCRTHPHAVRRRDLVGHGRCRRRALDRQPRAPARAHGAALRAAVVRLIPPAGAGRRRDRDGPRLRYDLADGAAALRLAGRRRRHRRRLVPQASATPERAAADRTRRHRLRHLAHARTRRSGVAARVALRRPATPRPRPSRARTPPCDLGLRPWRGTGPRRSGGGTSARPPPRSRCRRRPPR